jgi:hypothetical protein
LAALPDVAQTDVALNAVADEGAIESELITGLSIEARGRAKARTDSENPALLSNGWIATHSMARQPEKFG